uniref:Large ribosomal subunit protein bL9m n=1 Tax=Podarcis muralis TaxID=64176 RepID=A0A670K369_PODMU|nr:39S ribosomal protein L9, mitochondrial [Podarcis muralis]
MLAAARGLILARASLGVPLACRGLRLSAPLETCIVERWWKVPLSKVGREPRIKHRRYKVYRLVEDTKHKPKEPLELILTQTVDDVGSRGDTVLVPKSFGRSRLLNQNKAVYASPENKKIFEEENRLRQEGKLPRLQTHTGEKTVRFLRKCTLEVGVNDCEQFELTHEIVARHFLRNLGVVVLPHTLKLPDEPITELGEYWCEVTVNDLDTVRVPLSVVRFAEPKPESYRVWLAQPEDAPQQYH